MKKKALASASLLLLLITGCSSKTPPNINKYGKPYSPEIMNSTEQHQLIRADKLSYLDGSDDESYRIIRNLIDEGYPQAVYYFFASYVLNNENDWGCVRASRSSVTYYALGRTDRAVLQERLPSLASTYCELKYRKNHPLGKHVSFDEYLLKKKDPLLLSFALISELSYFEDGRTSYPFLGHHPLLINNKRNTYDKIKLSTSDKETYEELLDSIISYIEKNPNVKSLSNMVTKDDCIGDGITFPVECNSKELKFLELISFRDRPSEVILFSIPIILREKGLTANFTEIKKYVEKLKTLNEAGYDNGSFLSLLNFFTDTIEAYEAL